MPLTQEDVARIISSFDIIKQDGKRFTRCFYDCLFEYAPLIKPMFKKDRSVQEEHFFALLSLAVSNISRQDELTPVLIELGQKHKSFGVEENQFPLVKTAFMLAIEYELKANFNEAIKQAWSNYFDSLAEPMILGLRQ